jgi:hypothetical protein
MAPTLRITLSIALLEFLWTTHYAVILYAGMSCKHRARLRNCSSQVVQVPSCILTLAILEATFYTLLMCGLLRSLGFAARCVKTRVEISTYASFVESAFLEVKYACCGSPSRITQPASFYATPGQRAKVKRTERRRTRSIMPHMP